jgi:undecaprenyl diphosphate synthase
LEALPVRVEEPEVPRHIAIIMDGNGRWAQRRRLPRVEGHRRGADAVRRTVRAAGELGVSYLTLFGFSSENWKRSEEEVGDLMVLLKLYLRSEIAELHNNGVKFRMIGDRSRFSADIIQLIENAETTTAANTRMTLVLALSYGGRQEIAKAAQLLACDVVSGKISADTIDEFALARRLATNDIPDPDLLIRSSGEQRISNFLLWQLAYTELVFTDTLWPEFDYSDLTAAISEFQRRERRYGATASSV